MSFEQVMGTVQGMLTTTDALAAIAARLSLGNGAAESDPDVGEIDDVDAFDCAWVPTFFIPEKTLSEATPRIARALRSGGRIVYGLFSPPPNPLARATTELRTTRSGGCNLDDDRAGELLRGAGFTDIRTLVPPGPAPLKCVVGCKS